jgi:hypothetical protein
MTPEARITIRPRTTGEILDDAWRLYLRDAPLLLALSALFTVPFAITFLLLLTRPRPQSVVLQLLLPVLAALLLPLTGLGSGACQELFRLRAEGKRAGLGVCLGGALARWLDHVTARALVLVATLIGLGFLVMPGLGIWTGTGAVHPMIAARELRLFDALRVSAREASRHAGRALAVTLCRVPLFALALANVVALTAVALWVAGNLAGLDTALVGILLSPSDPVYLLAAALLSWVLLTPFAEASNFLLHADARARYEGLDLWYRVQQQFPTAERNRAVVLLVALGMGLLLAGPAAAAPRAEDDEAARQRLQTVHAARQSVDTIRQEVDRADPYPGSGRWVARLRTIAQALDPQGGVGKGPYRWFYHALDGFGQRSREGASQVLAGLSKRLVTAEESLALPPGSSDDPEDSRPALSKEEIKSQVPKPEPGAESGDGRSKPDKASRQEERRVRRDNEEPEEGGGEPSAHGPAVIAPHPVGGFGPLVWIILGGILLAVVAVACVFLLQQRAQAPASAPVQTGKTGPQAVDSLLNQPTPPTAAALWRQADRLAGEGNHLEAVRTLYAAVLALLHRANLIRYEPTRTNGEYAAQLRAGGQAPEEVHEPFRRLTRLFELKWYGERACRPEDYDACRGLAEEVRAVV